MSGSTDVVWVSLMSLAGTTASNLPYLLVWLVLGAVAVLRHDRTPRVAKLVLAAVGLELVSSLVFGALSSITPFYVVTQLHGSARNVGMVFFAIGFVHSMIGAVPIALLGWALFSRPETDD